MKRADIWRAAPAWLMAGAAAVVMPLPVWAAEHAEEGKAGLPQLDVTLYPGLLFWLVVLFFLFFLFMNAVGVPGVRATQAKRASVLGADLSAARAASEEAKKIVAEYEADLAKARHEAQATVNDILAAAAKEAETMGHKLQKELAHRLEVAEENIAAAHQRAMEDAPKQASALVIDLFDRVMKVEMGTPAAEARR